MQSVGPRDIILPVTPPSATNYEILFSTQLRLAPETQPLRESAIDSIVERAVFTFGGGYRPTLDELCRCAIIRPDGANQLVQTTTIEESLVRLIETGRISTEASTTVPKYYLPTHIFDTLAHEVEEHKNKMARVIALAFDDNDAPPALVPLFVACVFDIFSDLGTIYAQVLVGVQQPNTVAAHPSINFAVEKAAKTRPGEEKHRLGNALRRFILSKDPEAEHIKWVLGQNFYIAKSLGLDEGAQSLSREAFAHGSFYLDTNVALAALAPHAKHHASFKSFISACKQLDVTLWVAGITCRELEFTARGAAKTIKEVEGEIPDETATKIDSLFWNMYREERSRNPGIDVFEVMGRLQDPGTQLRKSYGVKYVDDKWFNTNEYSPKTKSLVSDVRLATAKRARGKNYAAAVHDALLLQWVEIERVKHNTRTWLLTLDYNLPTKENSEHLSGAGLWVTLEAIVHWIAPYLSQADQKKDFASLFSEMLRLQVLPQRRLFDLNDFRVLASMELQCKSLPPKDVEACVRRIHKLTATVDPTTAEGRERMSHEIRKFMADPDREFRKESEQRKSQLEDVERRLDRSMKKEKSDKRRILIYKVLIVILLWVTFLAIASIWLTARNPSLGIVDAMLNGTSFLVVISAVILAGGGCWIGSRQLRSLPALARRFFGGS